MTASVRALRPRAWVAATLAVLSTGGPLHAKLVSGDVSGDWTLLSNPVIATGDCRVPAGASLHIDPGVRFLLPPGASLVVDGTLDVAGAPQYPALVGPSEPTAGPWRSITVTPTGSASFQNCTLWGGGAFLPGEMSGMLRADGPSPVTQLTLNDCDITGSVSSGIYLNGATLACSGTHFFANGGNQPTDAAIHVATGVLALGTGADANSIENGVFGVYNEDVIPVDASGQWWGNASGPQHMGNIPGIGSSASDDVLYGGWITVSPHPAMGDLDMDGAVTVRDAAILLGVVGGIGTPASFPMALADVIPDGTLDIRDVSRLARVAAGVDVP